uniref:Uncharacterized protein n=1 Tax=Panagrolaimus sp. PS1159 TaxID=55785 RepID=A0AC35GVY9_9BILA
MSFDHPHIKSKPAKSNVKENIPPTGGRVEKKKLQSVVVVPATTTFKPTPSALETELREEKREFFKHESGYTYHLPIIKGKLEEFNNRTFT